MESSREANAKMGKRERPRLKSNRSPQQWTFFRQWLKSPLSIAAISPSGRQLARRMIAELPPGARRVIELGGGTGVFTAALLEHGIVDPELMVLELNEELHHHLSHRFPQVKVVCGDARELPRLAEECGFLAEGLADAVISGLGLLWMNKPTQRAILEAAFALLQPGGRFIQFTYGPGCPVSREVLSALSLHARRGELAWLNMPPATVYAFSRSRSKAIQPIAMRSRE
jgi:phosphatidylethanolamine/phosphatidyl-N-methylethanolamine N-methyltransferase